jgi:diguanylate cyclase (GGDEF)-like protein
VDSADIGAAMGDLSRVDLDQLAEDLEDTPGFCLLDGLAATYARLRLNDRLDEVRGILEHSVEDRSVVEQAIHWAGWSTELAGRGMEPVAGGNGDPDLHLLDRAVDVAVRLEGLPSGSVPDRLHRTARGVRALTAAYRGRPTEALRLLGRDAFADPRDLPAIERQVVTLAAMHAQALLGSVATARSLDEAATQHIGALPDLVLEVTRAQERLWLETQAGGDVVPVLYRLTGLLVRLGWQGMDQVADTARQALEHQALRAESRTDALTGVGNRRALDEELRRMLRFSPLPMALILVDIDDFKWVNDRFTHIVGDEVLRRVATSLQQQLRVGDKILRYGGDEFVVLLPRTGDQEARHVADRMGQAIAQLPWSELAEGLRAGITTGCAALWSLSGRRPDADAERLFRRADEALLEAKRARTDASVPEPGVTGHGRRRRSTAPSVPAPVAPPAAAGAAANGMSASGFPQPTTDFSQPTTELPPAAATAHPGRNRHRHATAADPDQAPPAVRHSPAPAVSGPVPQARQEPASSPMEPHPPLSPFPPVPPPATHPVSLGPPGHPLPQAPLPSSRPSSWEPSASSTAPWQPSSSSDPLTWHGTRPGRAASNNVPRPPSGVAYPDPGNGYAGNAVSAPEPAPEPLPESAPESLPEPETEAVGPWGPDPLSTSWRSTPLAADPLTSRSASDRMLTPPPEPGRTGSWTHRRADPSTGSMPVDPAYLGQARPRPTTASSPASDLVPETGEAKRYDERPDVPEAEDLPQRNWSGLPQRSRRRPAVIDLNNTEGPSRTPFG